MEFPEDIYKGLVLPKSSKPLKINVKEVVVKKKMTDDEIKAKEGTYFDEKDMDTIFDEDVDIYTEEDGQKILLAKLRKQVLDPQTIKIGWEGFWKTATATRNRGAASGPIDTKSTYWKNRTPVKVKGWLARYKQGGKTSKMVVSNNVNSTVLGYFESTPSMKLPCRLTSRTSMYFKNYKHGLPFIKAIDSCFAKLVPDRYKLQKKAASSKPLLQIDDTSFSSVTLNRNFRTALHKDAGDFKQGYGNLTVIERGAYHGGQTLFPQYKIGFNLRTGDFIAMDVHQWHCNTEIYETAEDKKINKLLPEIYHEKEETGTMGSNKPYTRLSFVCYLREKIVNCSSTETRKHFRKIGFNPTTITLKNKGQKKKEKLQTSNSSE
jgi:hypothetical protein